MVHGLVPALLFLLRRGSDESETVPGWVPSDGGLKETTRRCGLSCREGKGLKHANPGSVCWVFFTFHRAGHPLMGRLAEVGGKSSLTHSDK